MNRDHKIDKINAYRKLLETKKLPKLGENLEEDSLVSKELHAEFKNWIQDQISNLLGETKIYENTNQHFTNEEMSILKTLIAGVKSRRSTSLTPAEEAKQRPQIRAAPPKEQNPLSDSEKSRLNSTAKPLGNRKMGDLNKTSTASDSLISALDRMEEEGPNF